jgi:hypothetical protein
MMIKDRIIPAVNKVCNQINELQKKTCVVNPYENQFKEQYKIIEKLNKKIESNERESCDVLAKLKVEHNIQMRVTNRNSEIKNRENKFRD